MKTMNPDTVEATTAAMKVITALTVAKVATVIISRRIISPAPRK